MKLHIDFETRSRVDLKKVGAWAYAMHPSTEVMCLAYSIGGGPVRVVTAWDLASALIPSELWAALVDPATILVAHNAHFEYAIYHEILVKRFGWPPIEDPARWDCTLARAAMSNLPISLDMCGAALKISAKKDLIGRQAMLKLCKPGPDGEFLEDSELYKTLYEYCKGDVRAEMEIDSRLPAMPPAEKEVWNLDLLINKRGVRMDVPLARNAAAMVDGLTKDLNARLHTLTGGAVDKASRIAEIKRYLSANGLHVESLDKEAVTGILADPNIPQHLKDVVNIRRQVGKTSTSKYQAILDVAASREMGDCRARGLLQYHGASTGRWAGRLIQPHNFPKGVKPDEQRRIVEAIMEGDPEMFSLQFGTNAMDALSGALRGTMISDEDEELIVADYSTIEPRVLFWLADEAAALRGYREGKDLYLDLAEIVFSKKGLNKDEHPFERSVGKFGVLGCGYGMGAPRFQAQCATNGVKISLELSAVVVQAYRDKYSRVVRMWREVEAAAKKAVREPGVVVPCCGGRVHWGMDKKREFLICRLPSGRLLRYFRPSLQSSDWGQELHYMGPGLGGALEDQKTYGGSLVENIVQAIARDILAGAMLKLEMAGFDTLFHVHDEVVSRGADLPGGEASRKIVLGQYIKTMCDMPKWADGCPITAEGWIGKRYRK